MDRWNLTTLTGERLMKRITSITTALLDKKA